MRTSPRKARAIAITIAGETHARLQRAALLLFAGACAAALFGLQSLGGV